MKTRAERASAFAAVDLYPVISSEFCAGRSPWEVFQAVAAGGAKIVQLREKNWSGRDLYDLACVCRREADRRGMLLLIDDRADVALAAGADGVHVGLEDLSPRAVREIGPELLIGCSTHNAEEAAEANAPDSGADYFNIGPVFPTRTKKLSYPAVGVEGVRQIGSRARLPFSVMGGIKETHIPELLAAGAGRIAMVTQITQASDIERTVRILRKFWRGN